MRTTAAGTDDAVCEIKRDEDDEAVLVANDVVAGVRNLTPKALPFGAELRGENMLGLYISGVLAVFIEVLIWSLGGGLGVVFTSFVNLVLEVMCTLLFGT